jgi:hypothetical protein
MADETPKFTLRFHNPKTHELLGVVAQRMGMSKNQLAEQMLERELQAAALYLESDLLDTVSLLRSYRGDEALERDIEAVAEAEVTEDDPLRSHMEPLGDLADAYGVAEAFGS